MGYQLNAKVQSDADVRADWAIPHAHIARYTESGAHRNSRNVWVIPTQGRPEAHFATFPDELPRRCILAGTSAHGVCAECGAPWIRQTEKATEYDHTTSKAGKTKDGPYAAQTGNGAGTHDIRHGVRVNTQTTGWQPT